jgi:NADPH-dependent 2,4-dienoyl-CoA reductase/sulfur reductase-like enzyme
MMMTQQTLTSDVLVVGAGPAGIAAACAAAESGKSVLVLDNNPAIGGQIWRANPKNPQVARWYDRLVQANVSVLNGVEVYDADSNHYLYAESSSTSYRVHYESLVIATGARERFLPFLGWTLPGVLGVGGLQAMVKMGLSVEGKRIVLAGTGPLLLAVAAYLNKQKAKVLLIAEQTSFTKLLVFGLHLWDKPRKVRQLLALAPNLIGIALSTDTYPIAAKGDTALSSVTLRCGSRTWTIACDYLACGFGLVPNIELPILLGCEVHDGAVHVDAYQRSTIPDVYCAGEITGIAGLDSSLIEGEIAGYAAADNDSAAESLFTKRDKERKFAIHLENTFALQDMLMTLPDSQTIVCRCEDVTHSNLKDHPSWRAAKLHTRCGMGACQGRVCGSALQFLYGWEAASVRPPLFPVRLDSLLSNEDKP